MFKFTPGHAIRYNGQYKNEGSRILNDGAGSDGASIHTQGPVSDGVYIILLIWQVKKENLQLSIIFMLIHKYMNQHIVQKHLLVFVNKHSKYWIL